MKVPISTATENIAMMMPKMNFIIPNMALCIVGEVILGNDDAEDELHNSQYDFTDYAESHISQPSHQSDEG